MPIIHTPPPAPQQQTYPPGTTFGECVIFAGDLGLNTVDADGVIWKVIDGQWEGWDGSPGSTTEVDQRTNDHGAYATPGFLPPRYISVGGSVRAASHAQLHNASRRLTNTIKLSEFPLRVVERGGLELTAQVRRFGAIKFRTVTDTYGQWSVGLVALDPRKYGITEYALPLTLPSVSGGLVWPLTWPVIWSAEISPSSGTVTNAGNTDAYPTFEITGPVTDPIVTHEETGRLMRFGITLGVGQRLTIDTLRHRVLLGTADRSNTRTGDWLTLPPGPSTIRYLAATNDPASTCTVRWRDTYE
jgi:hypothetical protein